MYIWYIRICIYIYVCQIYFQMTCQKFCQNSLSRWGITGSKVIVLWFDCLIWVGFFHPKNKNPPY